MPNFTYKNQKICHIKIAEISSENALSTRKWCSSAISNESIPFYTYLLSKKYQIGFLAGGERAICDLGPNETQIYSHFNFVFMNSGDQFSLAKVLPSNPVNITSKSIDFTYETSYTSLKRLQYVHPIVHSYLIGAVFISIFGLVLSLFPNLFSKTYLKVLSRIPTHQYILVILCGAGAGVCGFSLSLLGLCFCGYQLFTMNMYFYIIPVFFSALCSSFVTTLLCSLWKLNDAASALYFAPLFYPSCAIALLFSVQWIAVGVHSCISVPLGAIFYIILLVVLVKIPTNLVGCLIMVSVLKLKKHTSTKVSVPVQRITRNRRHFFSASNSILFFLAYPIQQPIVDSIVNGKIQFEYQTAFLFCMIWLIMSICIGILCLGVRFERDNDWATFSFFSSAGGSIAIWCIANIWDAFIEHRTSTLHMTMHPVITAVVCVALALARGCISVLSSICWIAAKGKSVKCTRRK